MSCAVGEGQQLPLGEGPESAPRAGTARRAQRVGVAGVREAQLAVQGRVRRELGAEGLHPPLYVIARLTQGLRNRRREGVPLRPSGLWNQRRGGAPLRCAQMDSAPYRGKVPAHRVDATIPRTRHVLGAFTLYTAA